MAKQQGYLPDLAFQPYVAPQQQLPVEELNNVGVVLNKRYDDNMSKWDELDAYINQVQLSDADKNIKDSLVKDTREALKGIREKGNWENARLPVREMAKRLANDQALTIAQKNFAAAQKQKEEEGKLRMQGINLIDFNQGRYNQSTIDPVTGRARSLDFSGSERLQDYDTRRKSLFEGLQADGFDRENSSPVFDKATGAIYQVGSGSSARYVSKKKIQDIAKNNLNNYLESAEGQQEFRMLTSSNSMNPQPLDAKSARQVILNNITNSGMTRVFNQTGSKATNQIISAGTLGGGVAGGATDNPDREEAIPINHSIKNPLLASIVDKLDATKTRTGPTFQGGDIYSGQTSRVGRVPLTAEEGKMADRVALSLGIKKGSSGKYANADIKTIMNVLKQRQETASSPTYRAFTEEEITKNNNYAANGNLKGRGFYDPEAGQFYEFKNLPSKVRDIITEGKTSDIKFSGVISNDNPYYDAAKKSKREQNSDGWLRPEYISVGGKNYIVSSPISDIRKIDIPHTKAINQITKANREGIPVSLKGPDGKRFITYPTGEVDSKTRQPLYQIKDYDGNVITTMPLNNLGASVLQGMKIEE